MGSKTVGEKYIPWYLGQFDTNYVIFRNVELFKPLFLPNHKKYCEGK
jgi:hypothetical protein